MRRSKRSSERPTITADTSTLLRVYLDPKEIDEATGYPWQWEGSRPQVEENGRWGFVNLAPRIPIYVRDLSGHRCIRCGHPYEKGDGEWSSCDERCTHGEPVREIDVFDSDGDERVLTQAQWRILTVHHLNGVKYDCRWWNLAALCQRCHLTIQSKVYLERPWIREHSEWFKPYAAGWYAWRYLGEDLSREETMARLNELLAIERTQESLF